MSWLGEQVRQGMNARTYVLVGLLVVTLIWIQSLDEQQKRAHARASVAGGVSVVSAAMLAPGVKRGISTPTEPGWGRDPFERRFGVDDAAAPSKKASRRRSGTGASPALWLQGVMNGPAGRSALINGEVYREGERVGTREILQIGARSVLLLENGTVTTLTLKGDGS